MKKLIGLAVLIFLAAIAWNLFSNPDASTEALLKSIAESEELQTWIEEHPADALASDAKDTLVKAFPFLEKVLDLDNWKQALKTTGIDLMRKYMDSADPETQEKAETLGAVIRILAPDLADEVASVLGE